MSNSSKQTQLLLKGLSSSKPEKVIESIEKCRKDGDIITLNAILENLKNTDEPDVEAAIISFLYDLKNQECTPILIEHLKDQDLKYYQNFLVATFWQSSLDGSAYLKEFVDVAIEGDYMTAVEALTVIENFEHSFPEIELMDAEAALNEALEKEKDENKKTLFESMINVLRNLPIEGE